MEFIAMLLAVAGSIAFVRSVFRPIFVRATGDERRFQLVDLFSLAALWQYVLIFAALASRDVMESMRIATALALLVLITAVWLALISTMSRIGVQRASKRFVAVGLAVPAGIAATIVFFGSSWMLLDRHESSAVVIWVVAAFVGIACRAALRWATLPEPRENARIKAPLG